MIAPVLYHLRPLYCYYLTTSCASDSSPFSVLLKMFIAQCKGLFNACHLG